ncbi:MULTISPECIES: biotin transporter BioY [unclassified Bacillus (in: firmicutes)]|uniref:biotin transporter BioY n=1 Tax=unclassified Bacillus (in: firmicutes) TaxID=185979 RepID=UPI001114C7AA|nr:MULTISPECIES: biotin transporter BioY [unclassified Bacillus (in: firmicutes)]
MMRKKNKKMAMWILFVCVLFLGMYKIQAFAKFKQKSEYQISEELKGKEVKQLTFDEKKKIGEYFITAQLSVFEIQDKEEIKKIGMEIFSEDHIESGYGQLIRNYYPNRFHTLEYKFSNEEICEESDESFTYCAIAYVSGIENGKRDEMSLNYEMKIVKEKHTFKIAEQRQYVE